MRRTETRCFYRPILVATLIVWCVPFTAGAEDFAGAASLRAAIGDLAETFGDDYAAAECLAELSRLEARPDATQAQFDALRRKTLLANPLVAGRPILFVVRHQYKKDHHNTATMFQTGEINTGSFEGGGAMKCVHPADGSVTTIVDVPQGVARDPDVSFDGRQIVFSMRRDPADDYHLYEVNIDGSGLRQITYGQGVSDIDPIYLPDGRILFTSTREPKFCMCNRHIMGNLFVVNTDGSGLEQIGHSTLHEGHASLLSDGRVLYDRWEYVDRNFGDAQGVWTARPDGTDHAVYWGNNTNSPGAVLDARVIPGSERFVATFSSCHDRPWGALAVVDRRLGLDGKAPVVRCWPPDAINLVEKGNYDTFKKVEPKYEDPWPLSEKYFLCSRSFGPDHAMGLWLVDVFGNELLVHAEPPGCFDPMPLASRPMPPIVPPRTKLAAADGVFYIADVYEGSGMEAVERGSVRSIRVVESPEKRFWTGTYWNGGTGTQAPGMAWDDFNNKRILGTAPVEPDGSAYFAVPADTFVYFQLLDERGRMVQSMRSGTIVRPGETTGCTGCHENRRASFLSGRQPAAMARAASRLEPWYGPPRKFNYRTEVQPVFDRHCVSCHDYGRPEGEKLNLAGDLGLIFNTSYVELRRKGYVKVPGAGPYFVLAPKSWGSHASRLAKVMLDGHGDPEIDRQVKLTPEDIDRVVTWIDINGPYYPDYASAYRGNLFGRSPLDAGQLARLSELTGLKADKDGLGFQVNFTRPELSLCLRKFSGPDAPAYREALSIIRAGTEMLAARPRADMPGFQLVSQTEIDQEAKYERLATPRSGEQSPAQGSNTMGYGP